MQVDSSSVALAAAHSATVSSLVEQRLVLRGTPSFAPSSAASVAPQDSAEVTDPDALLIAWLYRLLTGKEAPGSFSLRSGAAGQAEAAADSAGASWSVSYSRREVYHEAESTSFVAEGSVTLASGSKIEFSLSLSMNRELTVINGVSVRAGNMSDPLVINFDGAGARLTAERQAFDLNSDGVDEMVATLAAGSAWLAQDRNGNGTVDNGGELFGPGTGSGFRELAALDADRDGWISEEDPGYNRLGVWNGGAFTSLREAGIGALLAAAVSTPFTFKDGLEELGRVRQSGVYLTESGTPGALQQVDLAL